MTGSTKDKDNNKVMVGSLGANTMAIQTGSTVGIPSKERAGSKTDSTKDHRVHKILQMTDKGIIEIKVSHKAISETKQDKTRADKVLEGKILEIRMEICQAEIPQHVNIAGNTFTEPEARIAYS